MLTVTWQRSQLTIFCPKRIISQHLEAYGSSKLTFPVSLRAICSAVSRDFMQPPQAVYLYMAFHKNWLQTNGFSSKITSPSLKFLLAKSPFPFSALTCFIEKWDMCDSHKFSFAPAMLEFIRNEPTSIKLSADCLQAATNQLLKY